MVFVARGVNGLRRPPPRIATVYSLRNADISIERVNEIWRAYYVVLEIEVFGSSTRRIYSIPAHRRPACDLRDPPHQLSAVTYLSFGPFGSRFTRAVPSIFVAESEKSPRRGSEALGRR